MAGEEILTHRVWERTRLEAKMDQDAMMALGKLVNSGRVSIENDLNEIVDAFGKYSESLEPRLAEKVIASVRRIEDAEARLMGALGALASTNNAKSKERWRFRRSPQ